MYDYLPDLKVVVTGSSILELIKGDSEESPLVSVSI